MPALQSHLGQRLTNATGRASNRRNCSLHNLLLVYLGRLLYHARLNVRAKI